ncbi:MAG: TPM domain-containing protein [Victivallaceae bacterium]|nr:TPM domain-containing protein [Victivallaceae bacterium]
MMGKLVSAFFACFALALSAAAATPWVDDPSGFLTDAQRQEISDNLHGANKSDVQFKMFIMPEFPESSGWLDGAFLEENGMPDNGVALVIGLNGRMQAVMGDAFQRYGRRHGIDIVRKRVGDYFAPLASDGEMLEAMRSFAAELRASAPQMNTSSDAFTHLIFCGALAFAILLLWEYRSKWRLRLAGVLLIVLIGLLVWLGCGYLLPPPETPPIIWENSIASR